MKKLESLNCKLLLSVFTWIITLGVFAQNVTVSGTVVDSNNEPVIGLTIVEFGNTSHGTVTDIDGNYTLNNVPSPVPAIAYRQIL